MRMQSSMRNRSRKSKTTKHQHPATPPPAPLPMPPLPAPDPSIRRVARDVFWFALVFPCNCTVVDLFMFVGRTYALVTLRLHSRVCFPWPKGGSRMFITVNRYPQRRGPFARPPAQCCRHTDDTKEKIFFFDKAELFLMPKFNFNTSFDTVQIMCY